VRRAAIAAVVATCVATASVVIGWVLRSGPYEQLAHDDYDHYRDPVWAADGWIYLLATGDDSESYPGLVRVRTGHRLESVRVAIPGCPEEVPSVDALFGLGDDAIGLMSRCRDAGSGRVVTASYRLSSGTVTVLGWYPYDGSSELSWRADGVGYGVWNSCAGGGIVQLTDTRSVCVLGQGSQRPVVGQGDVLYFVAERCGPITPDPPSTAVCRWHRTTKAFDIVVGGFAAIDNFGLHLASGRLAISGQRDGKPGMWLARADEQLRRIANERLHDPAFSPDGRQVVAVRNSDGLWGHTSTIVVVPTQG
jgi:hypothetical protein